MHRDELSAFGEQTARTYNGKRASPPYANWRNRHPELDLVGTTPVNWWWWRSKPAKPSILVSPGVLAEANAATSSAQQTLTYTGMKSACRCALMWYLWCTTATARVPRTFPIHSIPCCRRKNSAIFLPLIYGQPQQRNRRRKSSSGKPNAKRGPQQGGPKKTTRTGRPRSGGPVTSQQTVGRRQNAFEPLHLSCGVCSRREADVLIKPAPSASTEKLWWILATA